MTARAGLVALVIIAMLMAPSLAQSPSIAFVNVTVVPDSVTVNAVASSEPLPSLSYLPEIWLAESATSVIAWLPAVVCSPVAVPPARASSTRPCHT